MAHTLQTTSPVKQQKNEYEKYDVEALSNITQNDFIKRCDLKNNISAINSLMDKMHIILARY